MSFMEKNILCVSYAEPVAYALKREKVMGKDSYKVIVKHRPQN
jgi:hypothetical protein